MNFDRHPSPDQLTAFDAGLLPPGEQEAVERHVAECAVCCLFLERLPADALASRIRAFAGHSTCTAIQTPHADSPATATPAELAEGLRDHPRYRVLGLLGSGGMGAVYRARQVNLDRLVAIKVLHTQLTDQPGFAERFQDEVKALARLNHPNVVAAYDADRSAHLHFLVMEFVDGENLESLVARRGPLPPMEACELARQVAAGLQHAHEQGIAHRDIKPTNLLLTPGGVVKIADFGLARLVESGERGKSGSAVVLGTPEYMAPEQARDAHRADIRSDLYSLGCTLYFLLSGRPPFPGPSRLQTLLDHQDAVPPPVAGLTPAVGAVLDRLLAKDPGQRFSTPAEVVAALHPLAGHAEPAPPAKAARRLPVALGIGAVAALVSGGVIAFGPRDRQPEPRAEARAQVPAPAESTPPGPETAPMPRAVERGPLATPAELAARRKQALERAVEWVRVNNRWRPDAELAVRTAARVRGTQPKAEGVQLTFGAGLIKSETPTLLWAGTAGFFLFELSPAQARGASFGPMSHVFASYTHPPDARRATPWVRLSALRLDDANSYTPGARISGSVACEFPTPTSANDHLRITHFRGDGRRTMFMHYPKAALPAGRVEVRFSANPLEERTDRDGRLVVVFAEWVSTAGAPRVIESNTEAALLLVRPR